MDSGKLLFHDWETTGLNLHPNADVRKQPRAIEFGAVLFDIRKGQVEEEFSLIINPECDIEPIITKITGLTQADLAKAPVFKDVYPDVLRAHAAADGILSHNLPFDKQITITELARMGIAAFPWPQRELCTVNFFTPHWGRFPKLTEVYEFTMGKPLAQTHRALDDVKAMLEVCVAHQIWRFM